MHAPLTTSSIVANNVQKKNSKRWLICHPSKWMKVKILHHSVIEKDDSYIYHTWVLTFDYIILQKFTITNLWEFLCKNKPIKRKIFEETIEYNFSTQFYFSSPYDMIWFYRYCYGVPNHYWLTNSFSNINAIRNDIIYYSVKLFM